MDFEGYIRMGFEVELMADVSDECQDEFAEDLTEEGIGEVGSHALLVLEVLSE